MYFLLIISMLISVVASVRVQSTFSKYEKVESRRGMTGAEAAEHLLTANGVTNVRIEPCKGRLSDHYDPSANVIRLSEPVYGGRSVAAIGVAMHEAGHAVQYAQDYAPVRLRSAIVGVTNLASNISYIMILLSLFFGLTGLLDIGIILFCVVVFFQLVTLPVEFNASSRAMENMEQSMLFDADELKGAKKVLSAAAMTYVAAVAVSLLQLVRLLAIRGNRR